MHSHKGEAISSERNMAVFRQAFFGGARTKASGRNRSARLRAGALAALCLAGAVPLAVSAAAPPSFLEAARRAEALFADGDSFGAQTEYQEFLERALEAFAGRDAADAAADEAVVLPEVLVGIASLEAIFAETGGFGAALPALSRWAALEARSPAAAQVAARARWLEGLCRLAATGSIEVGEGTWSELGYLSGWRFVGPFDNERGGGFSTRYPPERELAYSRSYDGKKRKVSWRELPARPIAGRLDFSSLLDPKEEGLAYAATGIEADSPAEALLLLGTDEGYRVWLNGKLVGSENIHRAYRPDQTALPVRLDRGLNWLLVKVPQTTGPWTFAARLARRDFGVLRGWREAAPPEISELALEETEPPTPPASPVLALLDARTASDPADARAYYLRGRLLADLRPHDRGLHPDTESFLRAVQLEETAPHLLALAESYKREVTLEAQREENPRRRALERAVSAGSARAAFLLADYYFRSLNNRMRALAYLEKAAARNPSYGDAILLEGEIKEQMGFPLAKELALEAAWKLPNRSPELVVRWAGRLASKGRIAEAEKLLADHLKLDSTHEAARDRLADILARSGRLEEAADLLRAGAALSPFASKWRENLASLLEGADRLDDALAEIEAALRIAPEDISLLSRRAELLLRLERREEAIATLERALALQPNLPRVREYLDFLRSSKKRFEDEFRRDVAEILRRVFAEPAAESSGDPARVLLDLTAVEVHRDGTTKQYHQELIQVLNDRGVRMYDHFSTYYAPGEQVLEFLRARVHRPDGTKRDGRLRRYGASDASVSGEGDRDAGGGYSGASVDLPTLSTGDAAEVEYIREDVRQSFFGDYFGWQEVFPRSVPVAHKVFVLRAPADRRLYFHTRNLGAEPRKEVDEAAGTVTYSWELRDIAKIEPEPGMPPAKEIGPVLEISTFESWDAFGRWYWNLTREQYETSPEIARKVQELCSGAPNALEKVKAIYEFVIGEVRYNAWEFGVHGFKPYNAATIFSRRFGDCKDKATLLSVMLGEAGIRAWPVIINAQTRRGEEDLTLPMVNHFNHCISYVPDIPGYGSLYLDGTAQFHALEELPAMDRGAKVLVVREGGGSIQEIPWNRPEELAHFEEVTVLLREDLGARIQVRAQPAGDYAAGVRQNLEIAAQRKTEMERAYGSRYAGATVQAISFSELSNLREPVSFSVELDVPRFLEETAAGLRPALVEDFFWTGRQFRDVASLEKRTYDVLLGNPRTSVLRVAYVLPRGILLKSHPPEHDIATRFGRLRTSYREEADGVRFEREIELSAPRVSVADYPEFREFAAAVQRLEDERILFEKSP